MISRVSDVHGSEPMATQRMRLRSMPAPSRGSLMPFDAMPNDGGDRASFYGCGSGWTKRDAPTPHTECRRGRSPCRNAGLDEAISRSRRWGWAAWGGVPVMARLRTSRKWSP